MTPAENIGLLIDAWKLLVARFPGARIEQADGVATMFANIPLPFLNVSVLDRPAVTAKSMAAALDIAKQRAATCVHPSMIALSEDWVPGDWEQIATRHGFSRALNMTGMSAHELRPPRRPAPNIEFRRVTDVPTARDLAIVNAHAYKMPPELFECIANLCIWQAESFGYVGYADGRAITAAATFPAAGTIYVAFVATMPDAHGRGYAEAVMRKAIEEGQRSIGARRLTLHASDMGRPLYQSMGFQPGGSVPLLVPANP